MLDQGFELERIALILEGLEDTIIYGLIERAQWARNAIAYSPGASGFQEFPSLSLLEVRIRMQEEMDAAFGRFLVPEERPYSTTLPVAKRSPPRASHPFMLDELSIIDQNQKILPAYIGLLDSLCEATDDGHHGSCVEYDVFVLQALARRIHFGSLYVAESKFRSAPELYRSLVARGDRDGIFEALTRVEVEKRILQRVNDKLEHSQKVANTRIRRTVSPSVLADFYRDTIIPLTKAGELAYLFARAQT